MEGYGQNKGLIPTIWIRSFVAMVIPTIESKFTGWISKGPLNPPQSPH
jgi:hypothetical protein